MSDLDDLVAAMVLGDSDETVPLDVVTAMAQAAIKSGWFHYGDDTPCPHSSWRFVSTDGALRTFTCRICGFRVSRPESDYLPRTGPING